MYVQLTVCKSETMEGPCSNSTVFSSPSSCSELYAPHPRMFTNVSGLYEMLLFIGKYTDRAGLQQ